MHLKVYPKSISSLFPLKIIASLPEKFLKNNISLCRTLYNFCVECYGI